MKISLLVSNLSGNCLVRTYPIAKVLQRHFEIEIVGPAFSGTVFSPYRDEFPYACEPFPDGWWQTRWRRRLCSLRKAVVAPWRKVTGDVVYAFKPLLSSFGPGLLAHAFGRRPLVLDIEDWEAEQYFGASFAGKVRKLLQLGDPANPWYARWIESLVWLADQKTVASRFLQERFGGVRLVHGADCSFFDPARTDREALRRRWDVTNRRVILFTGQAAPHKGLADVSDALRKLGDPRNLLLVVGPLNDHLAEVAAAIPQYVRHIPPQPHAAMPEFLALSDVVVLPQRPTPYAQAQIPGKVFEAMAMAKPVIATDMSDLREILGDCGIITPPADTDALAQAIASVLQDSDRAAEMGLKARKKCVARYSWDAMEQVLLGVFQRYC